MVQNNGLSSKQYYRLGLWYYENTCFIKMNTTANSLRTTGVEKKMGDFLQETSVFHGPYEENVASNFKHVFQVT